jgi:hypothetical protein
MRLIGENPHPLVSARFPLRLFSSRNFAQDYLFLFTKEKEGFPEFTRFSIPIAREGCNLMLTAACSTIELPRNNKHFGTSRTYIPTLSAYCRFSIGITAACPDLSGLPRSIIDQNVPLSRDILGKNIFKSRKKVNIVLKNYLTNVSFFVSVKSPAVSLYIYTPDASPAPSNDTC